MKRVESPEATHVLTNQNTVCYRLGFFVHQISQPTNSIMPQQGERRPRRPKRVRQMQLSGRGKKDKNVSRGKRYSGGEVVQKAQASKAWASAMAHQASAPASGKRNSAHKKRGAACEITLGYIGDSANEEEDILENEEDREFKRAMSEADSQSFATNGLYFDHTPSSIPAGKWIVYKKRKKRKKRNSKERSEESAKS